MYERKDMKKKILALMMVLAVIAASLAGCGEKKEPEPQVQPGDLFKAFVEGTGEMELGEGFFAMLGLSSDKISEFEGGNYAAMLEALSFDELEGKSVELNVLERSYGPLDVQAPGNWYCLQLTLSGERYDLEGSSDLKLVFRELDGKLYLCNAVEGYYRTYAQINKYGMTQYGGSGGAANYGMRCYLPDANGVYREFYSEETNFGGVGFGGFTFYEGEEPAPGPINDYCNLLTESLMSMGYSYDNIQFGQTRIGDNYYYSVLSDDLDVMSMAEMMAQEHAVTLYTLDQVAAKIVERAAEFGIEDGERYDLNGVFEPEVVEDFTKK